MAERSYHHRKKHRRRMGWLWFWLSLLIILAIVIGYFVWDAMRSQSQPQDGKAIVSEFVVDEPKVQTINEPTYSFELPEDWVEDYRFTEEDAAGVTWRATADKQDNRQLTIYVDVIPVNIAVNKLLPVESVGRSLRHGQISENCIKYTANTDQAPNSKTNTKPVIARWEEVDFLCDLPNVFDNTIGTSSSDGINQVVVKGQEQGEHTYFFIYTDRNIHPNNDIFLDAIKSFRAK